MKKTVNIYSCDWCGANLLPHDNQVSFGNIDFCENCVGLKDCGELVARGVAQGKTPKETIQSCVKELRIMVY